MRKLILRLLIIIMCIFVFACGKSKENKDMYSLEIETIPSKKGLVMLSPNAKEYIKGTRIEIKPIDTCAYKFKGWLGENGSVIENNELVINKDINLRALFEEKDVYKYALRYDEDGILINRIVYEYNENFSIKKEIWYDSLNNIEMYYEYIYDNLLLKSIDKYTGNAIFESQKIFIYDENYEIIEERIVSNGGAIKICKYKKDGNKKEATSMLENDKKVRYHYNSNELLIREDELKKNKIEYFWDYTYDRNLLMTKAKKLPNGQIIEEYKYGYDENEFSDKYELKVSIEGLGIVNPIYGEFAVGEKVKLEPIANNGYYFEGWKGLRPSEALENQVIMDSDKNIVAVFREYNKVKNIKLNLYTIPEGSGKIIAIPNEALYYKDQEVKIKYVENSGYRFEQWLGENITDIRSDNTIVLDENKEIGVKFVQIPTPYEKMIYDGFGNLINEIEYIYNENKFLKKEIYRNALMKIEKYNEYIYYEGFPVRMDTKDKNDNLLEYTIYEYDEYMNLKSKKVYDKANDMKLRIVFQKDKNEAREKTYVYDKYGSITITEEKHIIYDKQNGKKVKEEKYRNDKMIETKQWIYDNEKIEKIITIDVLTGDIIEIAGYVYENNTKKKVESGEKQEIKQEKKYKSKLPRLYFRGTPNNWESRPMKLVSDYTWMVKIKLNRKDEFKFDVSGDWQYNFGDKDGDGKAERIDPNDISTYNIIVREKKGEYIVVFNDQTHRYQIYEEKVFNKIFFGK